MSGISDLQEQVAALKTAVDANTTSTNNEIAVVNQVIAALQAGGGLTDQQAEDLATQLKGSVDNLNASQAALDSEAQSIQAPPPAKP